MAAWFFFLCAVVSKTKMRPQCQLFKGYSVKHFKTLLLRPISLFLKLHGKNIWISLETVFFSPFFLLHLLYLSPSLCCSCPLRLSSFSLLQACNTKYPDYDKTGSICVSEHINNTLTRYRWLISAPAGPDGVTSPMREVDFDSFFTSSKMITLDSVYFQAGSRVQCAARAVNSNGDEGLELSSPIVTISQEEGKSRTMTGHFSV